MATCRVETPNGEYRCLFLSKKLGQAYFGDDYVAKGERVFLVRASDGQQVELTPELEEGYGATADKAIADGCAKFKDWARQQPTTTAKPDLKSN